MHSLVVFPSGWLGLAGRRLSGTESNKDVFLLAHPSFAEQVARAARTGGAQARGSNSKQNSERVSVRLRSCSSSKRAQGTESRRKRGGAGGFAFADTSLGRGQTLSWASRPCTWTLAAGSSRRGAKYARSTSTHFRHSLVRRCQSLLCSTQISTPR